MGDERQVVELFENRCAVCYRPFFQKRRGRLRRTCSAACRQKLYRMRQGEKKKAASKMAGRSRKGDTCPVCGGPIEQPARGRRRKTCSEACRKRLWRQENRTCPVCGKRFKPMAGQAKQKYCSKQCRWRASNARRRERMRAAMALAWIDGEGLPKRGSGYRAEVVPWEDGEQAAVIRERAAKPNYEERAKTAAERAAERAAWEAAQMEEAREAAREAKKARRLAWELLEDESKWWAV